MEVPDGSDERTRFVSRPRLPRLQRLGIGLSAQKPEQGSDVRPIRSHFRLDWSDQRRIQANISLIREDFVRSWV